MGERWTGTPCTERRPCTTVRPMAGKAGHTRAARARAPSTSASSSTATGPRNVESIFLKRALLDRRGASAAASRRMAAAASASERARVSVSRVTTSRSTSGRLGATTTLTGPCPAKRAPVSQAPVRSSATIVTSMGVLVTYHKGPRARGSGPIAMYTRFAMWRSLRRFATIVLCCAALPASAADTDHAKYTYLVGLDPKMEVAELYGARSVPSTFIIDRGGMLRAIALGPREWDGRAAYAYIETLLLETLLKDGRPHG